MDYIYGTYTQQEIEYSGDLIAAVCHGLSKRAGWWTSADRENTLVVPTKLMLIVSELAEALEGHRKNAISDKLQDCPAIAEELADAVIRIGDLAGFLGIQLGDIIAKKLIYNMSRADHKPEARAADGGKRY